MLAGLIQICSKLPPKGKEFSSHLFSFHINSDGITISEELIH